MKNGAFDYLQKPVSDQDLLDCIASALQKGAELHRVEQRRCEIEGRIAALTPREVEVMEGVVAGKSNKVIATHRGVSVKTVEAHRTRVMNKMSVGSTADLVRIVTIHRAVAERT